MIRSVPQGLQHAEEQAGDQEGSHDVEALGHEERTQDVAVLARDDLLQARVEADADEGQREEDRGEHLGHTRLGQLAPRIGDEDTARLQQAEDERGGHEAENELRELLPHDTQRGGLAAVSAAGREVEGNEEGHDTDQHILRRLDDDGVAVGRLTDDHARGGDARRGVDRSTDPRPGDLLGHVGGEEVRKDQFGQPRHEVDHRHDNDEHQRDDVGEFAAVAAHHARRRDAGRDAADRDAAREDHRRTFVHPGAPGRAEGEKPDDGHDQARLDEAEDARLHHVAEEDRGTEANHADLDEELALDGRLHPRGDMPHIADEQSEEHREEDRLEAPVGHGRDLGNQLGQQRNGEDHAQRGEEPLERTAEQSVAHIEHHEYDHEEQGDVAPCVQRGQGRGDIRQQSRDQCGEQEQRDGDPDHHPVFGAERFEKLFHRSKGDWIIRTFR